MMEEAFAQLMAIRHGGSSFPEHDDLFKRAFPKLFKLVSEADEKLAEAYRVEKGSKK